MKRLTVITALILLFSISGRGVFAQNALLLATPADSSSLLAGLGYPVIEFSTDGATITGPSELTAGRYLMTVDSTTESQDWEVGFFAPSPGETADQLEVAFAAMDPTSPGPPDWWLSVGMGGGVSALTNEVIVEVPSGSWVVGGIFFGETSMSTATMQVTVTGELPEYPAIDGAIQVTLSDTLIEMPSTVAAGPQIWVVTNTGILPNLAFVLDPGAELSADEAVGGLANYLELADATPIANGSPQDPSAWEDVAGSVPITHGVTTIIELDLEPGTYIGTCFSFSPDDLVSETLYQMTQVFTAE